MEDRSTSSMSLSISRISSNPPRPYLLISRVTEKGIRIPIYRSQIIDKMNRVQSANCDPNILEQAEEMNSSNSSKFHLFSRGFSSNNHSHERMDGGYNFGTINFLNEDLLNGNMKCTLLFVFMNSNPKSRDDYCGHALIPAAHLATIQDGSHFNIEFDSETVNKWRMESCRVINGNSDQIKSFKNMVNTKISSIQASSLLPENIEQIPTEKLANVLLSNFYEDSRNHYRCELGYLFELPVINSTHVGSLIIDEMETMYKNSFFDYRDVTSIDFMIAVDMSSSVKHNAHSNIRNP